MRRGYWIDVEGDEEAQRKLARLMLLLSDLRGFWPLVVPLFVQWMNRQFATEGSFGGQPWQPLSPAYASWKGANFPGAGILYREGDLRQAASRPARKATARTLTLTIEDPKAGYHQEGTDRMPARPIVFDELPARAQIELKGAAEVYVRSILARI